MHDYMYEIVYKHMQKHIKRVVWNYKQAALQKCEQVYIYVEVQNIEFLYNNFCKPMHDSIYKLTDVYMLKHLLCHIWNFYKY